MHRISLPFFLRGTDPLTIQDWGTNPEQEVGLTITFPIMEDLTPREAFEALRGQIEALEIAWITRDGNVWKFDLDQVRRLTEELNRVSWLKGQVVIDPELNWTHDLDKWLKDSERHLRFVVTRAELSGEGPDSPEDCVHKEL